jgi:hypothetical protein
VSKPTRKPRKPGAPRGNRNAAKATQRVQFNATADADTSWIAELLEVTNSRMIDALANCAIALSASAFVVEDGGWYATYTDADGETRETDDTAPTERAARILAGVECAIWRAQQLKRD